MPTITQINPNLVLKATETDLYEEYLNEAFFDSLAVDVAEEQDEDMRIPASCVTKKSKLVSQSKQYVEFGVTQQLTGQGKGEGETLAGSEEPIQTYDNAVYFVPLRHGVPVPLKGLDAHYNEVFGLIQKAQRLLSTWNGRVSENRAWQSMFKGCPDKVFTQFGTASPQSYHPEMYTMDAATVTKIAWNKTPATYETAVDTAIHAQASGDNISYDNFIAMETVAADNSIRKIPMSINGTTENLWLWVYPRAARARIKTELKDFFLSGDVRGPNNNALKGEKFRFGNFLFCEAAYISRILSSGTGSVTHQGAFDYSSSTNKRGDARTSTKGLMHIILGEGALDLAEPDKLQYDYEEVDYKVKKGIATYRMFGSRRCESFDDRLNITAVQNQSSIAVVEYNG